MRKVTSAGYPALLSAPWYLDYISFTQDWQNYYKVEPLNFNGQFSRQHLTVSVINVIWAGWVEAWMGSKFNRLTLENCAVVTRVGNTHASHCAWCFLKGVSVFHFWSLWHHICVCVCHVAEIRHYYPCLERKPTAVPEWDGKCYSIRVPGPSVHSLVPECYLLRPGLAGPLQGRPAGFQGFVAACFQHAHGSTCHSYAHTCKPVE